MVVNTSYLVLEDQLSYENEQVHVLTALYGAVSKGKTEADLDICKALELLKSATLVIDDFLDKSPLRNGMPSIFAKEGAELTVLKGEILKSLATTKLIEALRGDKRQYDKLLVLQIFEDTYTTICKGQLKDIELEKIPFNDYIPSIEEYIELITQTSAIYVRAPLLMAGVVHNFGRQDLQDLGSFGLNIGVAYQIRDDVLDIIGDPENIGKPYAGDIRERKKRLPIIHHLLENGGIVRKLMSKPVLTDSDVATIVEELRETGSIDFCVKQIERYRQLAERSSDNPKLSVIADLITNFQGGE